MTGTKRVAGLCAMAFMLTSTAAFAQDATRSGGALPVATAHAAPTVGVRNATSIKKKSNFIENGPVLIVAGLAAVAGAAIIASDDDDGPDRPDSAG